MIVPQVRPIVVAVAACVAVFSLLCTGEAEAAAAKVVVVADPDDRSREAIYLQHAVVSQLLIPTADGKGRCAVHEILMRTSGLPNVIRENKVSLLNSIIESGRSQGMQSMDDALFAAAKEERVRPIDAYMKAGNKARFESMLSDEEREQVAA